MDVLWEPESTAIGWIQGLGDWLAPPLVAVTQLGSQFVLIPLVALVFWCVHPGAGARLFVVLTASGVVNYLGKAVFYGARPYWYSAQVTAHSSGSSFGMPSQHAQASTVFWGYLGFRSGRRLLVWAAVALIAAICLSRIYLGVHYFSDVLVGLLLGGAVLWAALRWEDRIVAWWLGLDTARWVGYALAASAVPCLVAALWQSLVRGDWTVPAEWIGATPTDPAGYTLTSLFTVSGALLGGLAGFTLLAGRGWYSAEGSPTSRVARFALGISGIVVVQVVVHVVAGGLTGLTEAVVMFAAYAGIAFWAAFGAPEMFIRSGLARRPGPGAAGGAAGEGDGAGHGRSGGVFGGSSPRDDGK
ncbi:phosphatase PAP2 family protein [Nocardiopsis sp. NPDC058631]|uniref:phosphatase PAP2 family protein n=1 Tax=Nocardiopsis sp. NPDC058631 TaxID=3346566 RepID=UPI0036560809